MRRDGREQLPIVEQPVDVAAQHIAPHVHDAVGLPAGSQPGHGIPAQGVPSGVDLVAVHHQAVVRRQPARWAVHHATGLHRALVPLKGDGHIQQTQPRHLRHAGVGGKPLPGRRHGAVGIVAGIRQGILHDPHDPFRRPLRTQIRRKIQPLLRPAAVPYVGPVPAVRRRTRLRLPA